MRNFIVIGDKTTSGGVVLTSDENISFFDKKVACDGDLIYCKSCRQIGVIKTIGNRVSVKSPSGKELALENDLCICMCSPHPRLISSQSYASNKMESTLNSVDLGEIYNHNALLESSFFIKNCV